MGAPLRAARARGAMAPQDGLALPAGTVEWLVATGLVSRDAVLPARGDAVRLDEETSARFETGTVRGRRRPARTRRALQTGEAGL